MTGVPAPRRGGALTLHYSPGACSLAVHAALRHVGADFELARVDLRAGEHRSDAYRAVNARERVPALRVADETVTEVLAIALWIDRAYPDAALFPRDALARARALEWTAYLATTAHPLFRAYWRPEWFSDDHAAHAAIQRTAAKRLAAVYAELDGVVAARRALNGDTIGFADFYTAVFLRWASALAPPLPLAAATSAYRGRLQAHPAMAAALDVEGVSLETMKRRSDP